MKKIAYIFASLIAFSFASCSTDEIDKFVDNNYVYFDDTNAAGDSLKSKFTFTFSGDNVKEVTYSCPVYYYGRNIVNTASFAVEVIPELTTAVEGVHYKKIDNSDLSFEPNSNKSQFKVQLLRTDDMKSETFTLAVRLVDNGTFKVGPIERLIIDINDQLVQPDWWVYAPHTRFFGAYTNTKLLLLLEYMGVTDGSDPFDTPEYTYMSDRGTGNYIYKEIKDAAIRPVASAFRQWLINEKGNPVDERGNYVVNTLGSY